MLTNFREKGVIHFGGSFEAEFVKKSTKALRASFARNFSLGPGLRLEPRIPEDKFALVLTDLLLPLASGSCTYIAHVWKILRMYLLKNGSRTVALKLFQAQVLCIAALELH